MQIPVYITHKNLRSCTQNHGGDAFSVRKKRDSVSTCLKQNMTQTIMEHTVHEYVKGMCALFFILLNDSGKGAFGNAAFVYLFLIIGMHFWIFVGKFLVHLHWVYVSPQKLVRPLGLIGTVPL